jgi:hypothetical protein
MSPTDFTVTAATTTTVSSQSSSSCSVQVSTDTLRLRLSAQQLYACNALATALSTAATAAAVDTEFNSSGNCAVRASNKHQIRSYKQSTSSDLHRSDVTVATCCSEFATATTGDSTDGVTVCEGMFDNDSSSSDAWHIVEWVYAVPTRVRSVGINSDSPALTAAANTIVLELGYIDVLRQDAFAVVWQRQLEFGSTSSHSVIATANSASAVNANASSTQHRDYKALSSGAHISSSSSTSNSSGNDRWRFSDTIAAGVATAAAAPLAAVWQLRWTLVPHSNTTSSGRSRSISSSSSSSDAGGLTAVQIAAWLQQWVLVTSLQSPLARYARQNI